MTGLLAQIYRHPVKAIGRQVLRGVILEVGKIIPWDRAYAVAHSRSRATDLEQSWAKKSNYLRGVTGPSLMAVVAKFDEDAQTLRLTHPDTDPLEVQIDTADGQDALVQWLRAIWPLDVSEPTQVIHHAGNAQTDVPHPWVSIHTQASHDAVAAAMDAPDLSVHRWRGNLWLDELPAWSEMDWVGKDIRIGEAVFHVHQPITRCKATMANPLTGQRDLDTLAALQTNWGHQDFGVYASVIKGGRLTQGDPVEVL